MQFSFNCSCQRRSVTTAVIQIYWRKEVQFLLNCSWLYNGKSTSICRFCSSIKSTSSLVLLQHFISIQKAYTMISFGMIKSETLDKFIGRSFVFCLYIYITHTLSHTHLLGKVSPVSLCCCMVKNG